MSSVVLGLPKKLQPQPEAALSPECYSQMTRIFPNNVSSVTSPTTTMSIAAGTYNNLSQTVQEVRFSVPSGMGKNVFVDTSKSRLNFRARYVVSTGSTTNDTISSFLQSSAYSYWDRLQTLNQNGVAIDDVVGLGQIMAHKNNFEFNSAERDSFFNYGFRIEDESVSSVNFLQGHAIGNMTVSAGTLAVATQNYDYSIPLPSSLLGPSARNFCPIGALAALNLSLWTGNLLPIVYEAGGTATVGAQVSVILDNISIDLQYIYLDQKSASMLGMGKEYYVHSITNRLSTGSIPAATTGQTSVLIGLRGRSVRSLATRFSEAVSTTAGSANKSFDSKMIPATQLNYFLNGKDRVPNVVHNSVFAPTTVFEHALQAAEAFSPDKTKFGGTYANFATCCAGTTGASGLSQWAVAAGSNTAAGYLSAFCFAEDCRVVSSSVILDGRDLSTSASHYLELSIPTGTTNAINVSFISANDIIYVIDLEAGTIESRV